jgi:hypothetical protein
MKTRAAVAVAAGKPVEVTEVDLEGPRDGEVLVEIKATPTISPSRAPTRRVCSPLFSAMRGRASSSTSGEV